MSISNTKLPDQAVQPTQKPKRRKVRIKLKVKLKDHDAVLDEEAVKKALNKIDVKRVLEVVDQAPMRLISVDGVLKKKEGSKTRKPNQLGGTILPAPNVKPPFEVLYHKVGEQYWLPSNDFILVPARCISVKSNAKGNWYLDFQLPDQLARWTAKDRAEFESAYQKKWQFNPIALSVLATYAQPGLVPLSAKGTPAQLWTKLDMLSDLSIASLLNFLRNFQPGENYLPVSDRVCLSLLPTTPSFAFAEGELSEPFSEDSRKQWIESVDRWGTAASAWVKAPHIFQYVLSALDVERDSAYSCIVTTGTGRSMHTMARMVRFLAEFAEAKSLVSPNSDCVRVIESLGRTGTVNPNFLRRRRSSLGMMPGQNPAESAGAKRRLSRRMSALASPSSFSRLESVRILASPAATQSPLLNSRKNRLESLGWAMVVQPGASHQMNILQRALLGLMIVQAFTVSPGPKIVSSAVTSLECGISKTVFSRCRIACHLISCKPILSTNPFYHQAALNHSPSFFSSKSVGSVRMQRSASMLGYHNVESWPYNVFFQILEGAMTFLPRTLWESFRFPRSDPRAFDLFNAYISQLTSYRLSHSPSMQSDISSSHKSANAGDKQPEANAATEKKENDESHPIYDALLVDHAMEGETIFCSLKRAFGFSDAETQTVYGIVATILHLSSIRFCSFTNIAAFYLVTESKTAQQPPLAARRLQSNLGRLQKQSSGKNSLDSSTLTREQAVTLKVTGMPSPRAARYQRVEPSPLHPNTVGSILTISELMSLPLTTLLATFSSDLVSSLLMNQNKGEELVFETQNHADLYGIPSYASLRAVYPTLIEPTEGLGKCTSRNRFLPAWVGVNHWMDHLESRRVLETLISTLYGNLISWLVDRINSCLVTDVAIPKEESPLKMFPSSAICFVDIPCFTTWQVGYEDCLEAFTGHLTQHRLHAIFRYEFIETYTGLPADNTADVLIRDMLSRDSPRSIPSLLICRQNKMKAAQSSESGVSSSTDSLGVGEDSSEEDVAPEHPANMGPILPRPGPGTNYSVEYLSHRFEYGRSFVINRLPWHNCEYHTTNWATRPAKHITRVLKLWSRETGNEVLRDLLTVTRKTSRKEQSAASDRIADLYDKLDHVLLRLERIKPTFIIDIRHCPKDPNFSTSLFETLLWFDFGEVLRLERDRPQRFYITVESRIFCSKYRIIAGGRKQSPREVIRALTMRGTLSQGDMDEIKIQDDGQQIHFSPIVLNIIHKAWLREMTRRIAILQARYRGSRDRGAFVKFRDAARAHVMLRHCYDRAKNQKLDYLRPPVLENCDTGTKLFEKVLTLSNMIRRSTIFVSRPEYSTVALMLQELNEHAALLSESERMLQRNESKLEAIEQLLASMDAERLISECKNQLEARIRQLQQEEMLRKRIMRTLKRGDAEGAREMVASLEDPKGICNIQLKRLMESILLDDPQYTNKNQAAFIRQPILQNQKWKSGIDSQNLAPYVRGVVKNGRLHHLARQ